MNIRLIFPAYFAFFLMYMPVMAMTVKPDTLLNKLIEEEKNSIEALALYPDSIRSIILEAVTHPEALIKMKSLHSSSSEAFTSLIKDLPQDEQSKIWELTRYPELINQIVTQTLEAEYKLDEVLKNYPQDIHEIARYCRLKHYQKLIAINDLDTRTQSAFESIIADYTPETQFALSEITSLPEILDVLNNNLEMTILLGDLYKKNPEDVKNKLDSINLALARQNAKELQDWRDTLEHDPKAVEELKASAENFAKEEGYDESEIRNTTINQTIIVNRRWRPYCYWYGYPWWYTFPRWYNYPYWYDWGFYWGPGGSIVIFDLPSFYYLNWYYRYPTHHYYYPHLSNKFVHHYYGHRKSRSSVSYTTRQWIDDNKPKLHDDWFKDDGHLTERFKEYGDFNRSLENNKLKYPQKQVSYEGYLEKSKKKYPTVHKETFPTKTYEQKNAEPSAKINWPKIEISKPSKEVKINRAKTYHEKTWEFKKPTTVIKPSVNVQKRQPVVQPPKAVVVKKKPDSK